MLKTLFQNEYFEILKYMILFKITSVSNSQGNEWILSGN